MMNHQIRLMVRLGDYVRNLGIFEQGYFVLQAQLALLQARKLDLIRDGVVAQRLDGGVEVTMRLAQRDESHCGRVRCWTSHPLKQSTPIAHHLL